MTIRRVLAGVLLLVGGPTLVLAVLAMLGGNAALKPIALFGLMLSGLGVWLLIAPRQARPAARRTRGGRRAAAHHPYPATGDVGWYGPAGTGDHAHRGSSDDHPGSSGSGWSGGGWSGGDSGGFSGGGDSGGGGGD